MFTNEILALAWAVPLKTNKVSQFERLLVKYTSQGIPAGESKQFYRNGAVKPKAVGKLKTFVLNLVFHK